MSRLMSFYVSIMHSCPICNSHHSTDAGIECEIACITLLHRGRVMLKWDMMLAGAYCAALTLFVLFFLTQFLVQMASCD